MLKQFLTECRTRVPELERYGRRRRRTRRVVCAWGRSMIGYRRIRDARQKIGGKRLPFYLGTLRRFPSSDEAGKFFVHLVTLFGGTITLEKATTFAERVIKVNDCTESPEAAWAMIVEYLETLCPQAAEPVTTSARTTNMRPWQPVRREHAGTFGSPITA